MEPCVNVDLTPPDSPSVTCLRNLKICSNHPLQFDMPLVCDNPNSHKYWVVSSMEMALGSLNSDTGTPDAIDIQEATRADWSLSPNLKLLVMSLQDWRRPGQPPLKSVVYTQWTSEAQWSVPALIIGMSPGPHSWPECHLTTKGYAPPSNKTGSIIQHCKMVCTRNRGPIPGGVLRQALNRGLCCFNWCGRCWPQRLCGHCIHHGEIVY